jgi:ribosomal protein S5
MENGGQPATKREVETAIKTAVDAAKDELLEAMRGIETKLLHAFYGYAKSNDRAYLKWKRTRRYSALG